MALGTTSSGLRMMVLRQGLVMVGAGAVPGVIAAVFAAQWLEQLVKGAMEVTSAACFISLFPIAAVAALSAWLATGRIANMDPSAALRAE